MRKSVVFTVLLFAAVIILITILASVKRTSLGIALNSSYEPMNDYLTQFNDLLSEEPVDELLPVTEISAPWLFKDDADIILNASKGLRFANGDTLIIFFYEADHDVFPTILSDFAGSPIYDRERMTRFTIEKNFGFTLSSNNYGDFLEEMAKNAWNP